jgi:hypothetical protein
MPVNAEGTLIAFATGDNNTADDNAAEGNGLCTKYLIPALLTPGLQLREAFQKAKEDVYRASRKEQNPSIYENVVGAYYLVSPPTGGSIAPVNAAAEAWALVKDSGMPEDFDDFAKQVPGQRFSCRGEHARSAVAAGRGGEFRDAARQDEGESEGWINVWTITTGFWMGQTDVTQ